MSAKMFVKMSILLIPSCLLACTSNLFAVIVAIALIPVAHHVAKKWNCKFINKLAKCQIVKKIIDA